ncbi:MAG TPA: YkgJ family cysteine cluster protein [Gemmataceae bacterium]|nr:YkgJ family cysteine cluster protein [Gemmataceae bacterium]HVK09045.1 YkgJ family cysteine cluster protein [Gemmataceae bacterium]
MSTRVRIALKVFGQSLSVEGDVPLGAVRLDEVLPVLRAADNAVIDRAVARVEAAGERVSCAKGCATCCKAQPVPVTPPEAYALARLVEAMPEPRRSRVQAAFAANIDRLREAGLYEPLMDRDPAMTREQARDLGDRYFQLGLWCPFLEDDACGIYTERPFVCRQYLVTSPVPLCADPFRNPVQPVPIPARFASAMLTTTEQLIGTSQYTVPLALALEKAGRHEKELSATFDRNDVLDRVLGELAKG